MLAVHALNLALPGPAGDLAFIGVLVGRRGLRAGAVLGATAGARVAGLGALAALGLALLPFAPAGGPLAQGLLIGLFAMAAPGLALGLAALRPAPLRRAFAAAADRLVRLPAPVGPAAGKVLGGLIRALGALGEGLTPRAALGAAGWSLAIQALLALSLAAAARASGISLMGLPLALAHVTGELASVAVAVAPGGLGAFEAGLGAALVAFAGQPAAAAAAVVLAVRLTQVVALSVGALAVAARAPELLAAAPGAERPPAEPPA